MSSATHIIDITAGAKQMSRCLLNLTALLGLVAIPSVASADLVVTIQNSTAVVGQQGFFDIFVTSNSAQASADLVNNYSIGLLTPTPSGGVSYTQTVTASTAAEDGYIFPASSPQNITFLPALQSLRYTDAGAAASIFVGQTFGVGRVFYDALAIGQYTVNFDFGNPADPFNLSPTVFQLGLNEVPVAQYNPGTITVIAAPAEVPEPSSAILLALTGVAGVAVRRMRRKTVSKAECPA